MTQTPPAALDPGADTLDAATPVHEMPPYTKPRRWRTALLIGAVLLFLAVCVFLFCRVVRAVWRWLTVLPMRTETIMFAVPDQSYAGPTYRVGFYDGTYPQLTNDRISFAPTQGIPMDAQLRVLAGQLASRVRARDGQICEQPRVVLYDQLGHVVYEWTGAA